MTSDIEKQLDRAITVLGIPIEVFRKCAPDHAKLIVGKARERFVIGNPRAWWMALKQPFESFDYSEGLGFEDLIRHIPTGNDKCWFVPETEEEYPPVFDATVGRITEVLGECAYFEYYLIGKEFDWLVLENDHNQIIVSRSTDNQSQRLRSK